MSECFLAMTADKLLQTFCRTNAELRRFKFEGISRVCCKIEKRDRYCNHKFSQLGLAFSFL